MNNSNQIKTHFDKKILLFFLVVFTVSCLFLAFKMNYKPKCDVTDFKVEVKSKNGNLVALSDTTKTLFKVGSELTFSDTTKKSSEWNWSFGDGNAVSYKSKATHVFEKEGNYNIKLVINKDCTIDKVLTIVPNEENSNEIIIGYSPGIVKQGDLVSFKDLSKKATKWQWRFGDGSMSESQNPTHKYKTSGNKIVTLVVNGDFNHINKVELFVNPVVVVDNSIEKEIKNREKAKVPVVRQAETPKLPGITEELFKQMLLGVADKKLSYEKITPYFCVSSLPEIKTKKGKILSLKQLYDEIRNSNKKLFVRSVVLSKDNNECTKQITLDYSLSYF